MPVELIPWLVLADWLWLRIATLCLASYLTWYIWRFSIRPILRPAEPLELPYLIPGTHEQIRVEEVC